MIDDDWRDYVEDLKKKMMHNGIVGDYYKSTDELEEETKKLLSIVEVINNEIEIREKVQSELIWAKVISKINAKVLNGDTKVYERTTGSAHRRISYSSYNTTSPPSLVSFAQATTSSSGGQRPTTPQQLEPVAEQQDDEQPQEANLQEVQQAQIVLQAHAVKDA